MVIYGGLSLWNSTRPWGYPHCCYSIWFSHIPRRLKWFTKRTIKLLKALFFTNVYNHDMYIYCILLVYYKMLFAVYALVQTLI